MKRAILLVLLALCVAVIVALACAVGPLWAATKTHDVLITLPRMSTADVTDGPHHATLRNKVRWLQDILDAARCDYILKGSTQVKTEQVRTGRIDIASGPTINFRSLVVFGVQSTNNYCSQSGVGGKLRLDSLTMMARGGVTVPSLLLIDNAGESKSGAGGSVAWLDSATSPTAVKAGLRGAMVVAPGVSIIRSKALPTRPWFGVSYVAGYEADPTIFGGIRPLLTTYSSSVGSDYWAQHRNSDRPDSAAYALPGAGIDTLIVHDRLWQSASTPDAKIMTVVKYAGVGYGLDSLQNADGTTALAKYDLDAEGDETVLLYGLAHFDSVTAQYQADGKGLIFKNLPEPFRLSLVIYGLGTRNLRRFQRGILPSDTAVAYAKMDSLRVAGIPVTYAVDPDSVAAYPRDLAKALENPYARFTPQTWAGVFDSSGMIGNTSQTRLVDPWGHFRKRAFFGDSLTHTVTGSDTSITQQLLWQRAKLLGVLMARGLTLAQARLRMSTCAVAPLDDYSPVSMSALSKSGADLADSLILAAQRAGYTHLLSNIRYRTHDPSYHRSGALPRTNPHGWFRKQGPIYNQLTGERFMLLGHNEQPLFSGEKQGIMFEDSTTAGIRPLSMGVQRAIHGAIMRCQHVDYDQQMPAGNTGWTNTVGNEQFYALGYPNIRISAEEWNTLPQGHASVLSLSFNSISGDPADPACAGWWTVKWLDNAFRNINGAAGKTIIRWVYPEEIGR